MLIGTCVEAKDNHEVIGIAKTNVELETTVFKIHQLSKKWMRLW